jgi:hypothetical protein
MFYIITPVLIINLNMKLYYAMKILILRVSKFTMFDNLDLLYPLKKDAIFFGKLKDYPP